MDKDDLDALWLEYKSSDDVELRNKLVLHYHFLAESAASGLVSKLNVGTTRDDLINYGVIGLIDAIEKFEPERGLQFTTYSAYRIRGAIYDAYRELSWTPRRVVEELKDRYDSRDAYHLEYGARPSDKELAEFSGVSFKQVKKVAYYSSYNDVDSIGKSFAGTGDDSLALEDILSSDDKGPEDTYVDSALVGILSELVGRLPERETIVLSLYYYEGHTLSEIGDIMGFTESNACHVKNSGIKQLKQLLCDEGM